MANFLTRIFGSRNQRMLRQYTKTVNNINSLEEGLKALVAEKRPFKYHRVPVEEARRQFVHGGSDFKRKILEHWPSAFGNQ